MTNQNADKRTYFADLFCREIAKDPQNLKKNTEAFSDFVPKNQQIEFVIREGQCGKNLMCLLAQREVTILKQVLSRLKGQGLIKLRA